MTWNIFPIKFFITVCANIKYFHQMNVNHCIILIFPFVKLSYCFLIEYHTYKTWSLTLYFAFKRCYLRIIISFSSFSTQDFHITVTANGPDFHFRTTFCFPCVCCIDTLFCCSCRWSVLFLLWKLVKTICLQWP